MRLRPGQETPARGEGPLQVPSVPDRGEARLPRRRSSPGGGWAGSWSRSGGRRTGEPGPGERRRGSGSSPGRRRRPPRSRGRRAGGDAHGGARPGEGGGGRRDGLPPRPEGDAGPLPAGGEGRGAGVDVLKVAVTLRSGGDLLRIMALRRRPGGAGTPHQAPGPPARPSDSPRGREAPGPRPAGPRVPGGPLEGHWRPGGSALQAQVGVLRQGVLAGIRPSRGASVAPTLLVSPLCKMVT